MRQMACITEEEILRSCDSFFHKHGFYPNGNTKLPVPGRPNDSWQALNIALCQGCRGLQPGSSIPKLLDKYSRRKRERVATSTVQLSEFSILADMCNFKEEHGIWPTPHCKTPVPGKPDESWRAYDTALRKGGRGLPGGRSLCKLANPIKKTMAGFLTPEVLANLPETDSFIYNSYFIQGKTQQEIGAALGVTQAAISAKIDLGVKRIPVISSIASITEQEIRRDLIGHITPVDIDVLVYMHKTLSQSKTAEILSTDQAWVRRRLHASVNIMKWVPGLEKYFSVFSTIAFKKFKTTWNRNPNLWNSKKREPSA